MIWPMNPDNSAGFTLLELLITLTIASILAVIAVPAFQSSVQNSRLSSQLNTLVATLSFARSEAITRSADISVCASTDLATCDTSNWENGYMVFAGDAAATPNPAAANIIQIVDTLSGDNTLRRTNATTAIPAGFNAGYLRYEGTGFIQGDDVGSFTLCDNRGAGDGRALNINTAGQIKIGLDSNTDGTVERIFNNAIVAITCP